MKELYGVTVAMTTPFFADGSVDYAGVEQLTEFLIEQGVDCLYPCGTTGEMMRLTVDERKKIAQAVVQKAAKRVTVFIHVGCMRQEDTIELSKHAKEVGADGIGVVTPQFFGVNDREMEEYYVTVANSVPGFPVYLYNIPQCASNDLKTAVAERIAARCDNVVGIKYSWADMARTLEYINIRDGNFSVLHGSDKLLVSLLDMGCKGTVSGCANVFPEPFVNAYRAYQEGDMEKARHWQKIAVYFVDALKAGSNMSYFKEGMKLRGINAGLMRAPQLDLPGEEISALKATLTAICEKAGLSLKLQ